MAIEFGMNGFDYYTDMKKVAEAFPTITSPLDQALAELTKSGEYMARSASLDELSAVAESVGAIFTAEQKSTEKPLPIVGLDADAQLTNELIREFNTTEIKW